MSLQQSGDQLGEKGMIDKIKNILDNNRENLLIVAFVLIIIGGVWAYMQAPQKPDASSGTASEVGAQNEKNKNEENKTEEVKPEENKTTEVAKAETTATPAKTKPESTPAPAEKEPKTTPEPVSTPAANDRQTITITAIKGDGLTHVARKALKEYLTSGSEKLNSEQKIYIEDYLRKHSAYKTVNPGEALAYSNDLVKTAIDKSKALTAAQLKNLEKYSKLVKNL